MNIDEIKKKLEGMGYLSFISSGSLIVGQMDSYDTDLECMLLKGTFSIDVKNDRIILEYSEAAISKEKEFVSFEEFSDFIKINFPISN